MNGLKFMPPDKLNDGQLMNQMKGGIFKTEYMKFEVMHEKL